MKQTDSIEERLAKIPSVIVEGTHCWSAPEAREAVRTLSREDLLNALNYARKDKRILGNAFCFYTRRAEDFALEQIGNLAFLRRDIELRNRVAVRYRELAASTTDEVEREDYLSAASHFQVTQK